MTANNIGVQIRRFVAVCQSESDPARGSSHPFNRPLGEWQHLTELTASLIQSCPPVRASVLNFTYPIVVAHLQNISQQQQISADGKTQPKRKSQSTPNPPVEKFILSVFSEVIIFLVF